MIPDEVLQPPQDMISSLPLDPTPESMSASDLGNAARLALWHMGDIRWTAEWGWIAWDGRRWVKKAQAEVERRAVEVVRAMYDPMLGLIAWAVESQERRRLSAMVELAKRYLEIDVGLFDRDPWLLNVANGTLDLRTAELTPHKREDYLTRIVEVSYDPDAEAPVFDGFLARIFDGDEELVGYLRRATGLSLQGDVSGQVIFVCFGTGANGKTTFMEALHDLLGSYARKIPIESLTKRRPGSIPNDLAQLPGVRLVTAVESDIDGKLAEGLVKSITGSDTIQARFLFKEFFEFRPQLTPWIGTNHLPQIRGTNHAIWRRIKVIPFEVVIPDDEQDRDLPAKLRAELPGILAWAVRGCLEWQQIDLAEPESIRAAVSGYRESQDPVGQWIDDACHVDEGYWTSTRSLHDSYMQWATDNAGPELSDTDFGRRLRERGLEDSRRYEKGKRLRGWSGLQPRNLRESGNGGSMRGSGPKEGSGS